MLSESSVPAAAVIGIAVAGSIYLVLRWVLQPVLLRMTAGIDLIVDVTGALLLMPEFACTSVTRRVIKRPAPFAFVYGDAVSGAACVAHAAIQTVVSALQKASLKLGHRESVIGAVVGAVAVVLL